MDKITHHVRCEQWTSIINECLANGMNKTAWCRENGISEKQFFYWQRILRKEAYIGMNPPKGELPAVSKTAFVELTPPAQGKVPVSDFRPDVVIRSGDLTVEISNTASHDLLSMLGGLFHAQ